MNGIERSRYSEFSTFLRRYGVVHKNRDGLVCNRCHNKIIPGESGVPDYSWYINSYGTVIEMKGGPDRITFAQIKTEQREHINWFQEVAGSVAWLAVTTGDGPVNSTNIKSRKRFWMFDWCKWLELETKAKEAGVQYLPTYYKEGMRLKDNQLALINYPEYELRWELGGWVFNTNHLAVQMYNIDPNRNIPKEKQHVTEV